jgi:protein phosphatase
MRIIPGNAQHLGSRQEQQDDFGFSNIENVAFVNHGGVLAVVTDGMGGLAQGREASLIAKKTMLREYEEKAVNKTIPQALIRALSATNTKVLELARQAGLEGQIGTTLTAAVIKGDELYWVSVGDSRVYLYRQGKLMQLTTDHDYARELAREVALGRIGPEKADSHPQRQALTSYLGLPFLHEIDRNEVPVILEAGDRILLCSDGLYKTLPDAEIVNSLDREPQQAADSLIEATLARGKTNQDNVTVAILSYDTDLEISIFKYWCGIINHYGKVLIIILVLLLGFGGVAYLTSHYFISLEIHAKDVAATGNTSSSLDFTGPPMMELGASIVQENKDEEQPKGPNKRSRGRKNEARRERQPLNQPKK